MKPDRYFRDSEDGSGEEEMTLREFLQAAKANGAEGEWQFYDAQGREYWVYGS